jgi:hypothetical protein
MKGLREFEKGLEMYSPEPAQWEHARNVLAGLMVVAAGACVGGCFSDPRQFLASWLTAFLYGVTILFGALFFVLVQHLTNAAWSITVRRLAENMIANFPLAGLLFLPVAFGAGELYAWVHQPPHGKDAYLNPAAFFTRAAIYFAAWSILSLVLCRYSRRQDDTKALWMSRAAAYWSAPGMLLAFVSITLASFDWVMSLDPHWYSTIFGVYVFAGGTMALYAALIRISLRLRRAGILSGTIHVEHYHDLGKWLLAMTAFWGYIAFSQYMLIWYGNLPEETLFYKHRMEGTWLYVSLALPVLHFAVPFFLLMPRASKRNLRVLGGAAMLMLVMHYVDIYWLVMPAFSPHGVHLHWMDAAAMAAVLSILGLGFWYRARKAPLVPQGDPRFLKGLEFQNV